MTPEDIATGALCAWRENRGGGVRGMQSVINVLMNRAKKRGSDVYVEATRRLQFSSMTAQGDPELTLYPNENDPQYIEALDLMNQASDGTLEDITEGSTEYVTVALANSAQCPEWVKTLREQHKQTVIIENQVFFKE